MKNRHDINAILGQLCKEQVITSQVAGNMHNNANMDDNDYKRLSEGATYVPLRAAILLHCEARSKPIKIV